MEANRKTPITGREGSAIDLGVAADWTKNYREKHPGEAISQFFGKEILEKILAQKDCLGIRFYYAYDHQGKKHLIITGAMADGTDQIHHPNEKSAVHANTATAGQPVVYTVGEMSTPCPGSPGCPTNALTGSKS